MRASLVTPRAQARRSRFPSCPAPAQPEARTGQPALVTAPPLPETNPLARHLEQQRAGLVPQRPLKQSREAEDNIAALSRHVGLVPEGNVVTAKAKQNGSVTVDDIED